MMSLLVSFVVVVAFLPNGKGTPCTYSSGGRRYDNVDERGPYLEGDMILKGFDSHPILFPQLEGISRGTIWPNAQLVYMMDPYFQPTEVAVIQEALRDISNKTCVTFRERSKFDFDFVYIQHGVRGSGCWSFVGRIGGKQMINLESPACMISGVVAHEILHSLNRLHEHSRYDRDDYIFVNYTNIQLGAEGNFRRFPPEELNTLGVPYDYSSIMHYSQYAFSRQPQLSTIIPRQRGIRIGQRVALSPRDSQTINLMYGCG